MTTGEAVFVFICFCINPLFGLLVYLAVTATDD